MKHSGERNKKMKNEKTGVEERDLAHPKTERNKPAAEAQPQNNIDEMSDEEFLAYLEEVSDGKKPLEEKAAAEAEEPEEITEEAEAEPFKSFETKEDYQRDFDERFNRRFKNHKEMEEVLNLARDVYGGGDDRAVLERLKQSLIQDAAEEQGKTAEEYEEEAALRRKAAKYDELMKEQEERSSIMNRWLEDSEKIKGFNPDFDLEEALKNSEFRDNLVNRGMTVAESAYALLNGGKKQAPERSILQNASSGTQSASPKNDPSKLSEAEFKRYIDNIKGKI